MAVVALFFKLSMAVRDFHNHLVENVGIPSWASYSMFAVVTLGLGCILGFVRALHSRSLFIVSISVHRLHHRRCLPNWFCRCREEGCCRKEEEGQGNQRAV